MSVRDFMSKDLVTVSAKTPIFDAIDFTSGAKIFSH